MAMTFDVVDRYCVTVVDFWVKRPRKFLESRAVNPDRYLTPPQFLLSCMGIMMILIIANISFYEDLPKDVIEKIPALELQAKPKVLATRQAALMLSLVVFNSITLLVVSRLWPVRGKANLKDILFFQFYLFAVFLPFSVVELLGTPFLLNYIRSAEQESAVLALLIMPMIGAIGGSVVGLVYNLPGLAYLNGVSTSRFFWACMLWGGLMGILLVVLVAAFFL